MKIGEVSKLTGLSVSNIRFYEKKGLLTPERDDESKYREYSGADIDLLNRIILYRKMDLSIETIEAILQEEISLKDALKEQLKTLEDRREQLEGAIHLCREMISYGDADEKDTEYYMNFVKQEETKGHKFFQINDMLSDYVEEVWNNRGIFFPDFYIGKMNVSKGLRIFFAIFVIIIPIVSLVSLLLYPDHHGSMEFFGVFLLVLICWGSFLGFVIGNKKNR